jgi:hypothetical protein
MAREGANAVGRPFGERGESSSGAVGPRSIGGASGLAGGGRGGMFGGEDLSSILEYTEAHGGGTIAVDSQSGAASSIIESGAEVAGIGGFSGKESSVSAKWLEERIESGQIAWIYTSGLRAPGGDSRTGSESAIDTVVKSCAEIPASAYISSSESAGAESAAGGTLYRCGGS